MKLSANGINLGALHAAEDGKVEARDIGEVGIAVNGLTQVTRSARKLDHSFKTVPVTLPEAHAWRMFLTGEGEAWSFDSSLYGSKGSGPTSSALATISAGSAKFGASKLSLGATTGSIAFNGAAANEFGSSTLWTVGVWRYESGVWNHYIVRSDGAKWVNGVRNDLASTAWLIVSTGNVVLSNSGIGVATFYDDLVVLPFAILTAWAPQWYASTLPWSSSPFLTLAGDIVTEAATRTVYGIIESAEYLKAAAGVLMRLEVKLQHR